jgi:PAS domain S-box-containing protein
MYDAITDFITVISTAYRIARTNRIVEKLYGKDLIGKVCYEVYQGRKEICPECPTRKAIETKKPAFSFQPATELSPPVEIYAFPILNKEGDVIAVVEHGKDITERKRVEDALAESEERYRNIAENSSIGIGTYHESGQCVVANQALADMVGATVEQVLSQNIHTIQSWQESGMLDVAKEALESGEKRRKTVRVVTTYGKDVWLDCTLIPYHERGKKFLMLLAEEITQRKTMEEELLKAQKLESIGILAGGIAHDFNNLLTAIMNNLYLMKSHINPEEQVCDWIKATENAAVRAQSLTQQLLTFSKGGEPIKGLIDIRELVSESISIALRGSNVKCENLIPYDVWHIEADAGQMNQAINNILINADQSMPEGGIITVNCENVVVGTENNLTLKEGNYLKISFMDQGTGISREHLPRIFDPYFTTKQKGSGLGLSTTYSIIKRHHGHINVESELGAGTVFNIYLPASGEIVKIKKPAEDELVTGTGKVLVMDDNELVRDSLGQMLTNIGYVVEFACDGREAVDIYKSAMASGHSFNSVIMDLTIPGGMGGKEAVRELLKIDPNVKAIVSSGYSNDPIMSNYRDYGFRAVLSKPYKDMRELNRILHDEIEGK